MTTNNQIRIVNLANLIKQSVYISLNNMVSDILFVCKTSLLHHVISKNDMSSSLDGSDV